MQKYGKDLETIKVHIAQLNQMKADLEQRQIDVEQHYDQVKSVISAAEMDWRWTKRKRKDLNSEIWDPEVERDARPEPIDPTNYAGRKVAGRVALASLENCGGTAP